MPVLIHYAFCMSVTAYMWDFNLCICWPVSLVIKYDKCVRICEMCPFGHVAVDVCLLLCDQCIGQIIRFLCKEHYQKLRTVIRTTCEINVCKVLAQSLMEIQLKSKVTLTGAWARQAGSDHRGFPGWLTCSRSGIRQPRRNLEHGWVAFGSIYR